MTRIGLAPFAFVALAGGSAHAEALGVQDLYRTAEALAQSLVGLPPPDQAIIKPRGNIDPQMALAPPRGGTMRLIQPSEPFRQR